MAKMPSFTDHADVTLRISPVLYPPDLRRTFSTQVGVTGLLFAAENGHVEVARLLLDRGASLDVATEV
jgi:ankyrin repeat protein